MYAAHSARRSCCTPGRSASGWQRGPPTATTSPDRLHEGDDLRAALDVWVVDDGQDVILEDDLSPGPSAAFAG
jgi:hypothetical protein